MHTLRYKYSFSTESIETMLPWELDIELALIEQDIQKEIIKAQNSDY